MRQEGLDFVQKKLQRKIQSGDEILFHEEQLVDYFGETYASDPSTFRFEIGDRKLIRIVRDHLIKQQTEKGAKYKRRFRKKPERKYQKRFKHSATIDQHRKTAENGNKDDLMDAEMLDNEDGVVSRELSAGLFERVKNYMRTFDIDDAIIQTINPNIVSVKIINDLVVAEVFCAVCQNDGAKKRKMKGKRVFYKGGEGSRYWVLSNFGQHLKKVHKLSSKSLETSVDVKIECGDAHNSDDHLALLHNFSIEYVDVKDDPSQQTNQTNANESNAMFDQITTQIRKMLEATLLHNDDTHQMLFELTEGKPRPLKIATIAPDGACLFGSITHQLFGHKINSREHTDATKQLRKSVVEYISRHYSSFKFALKGRVYDEINLTQITDLDKECKNILEKYLPLNYYWGGTETLKAVQEMYHVNILIFNEHGTCRFCKQFDEANERTLILAYKLTNLKDHDHYEHYDSVCDISTNEMLNSIDFLSNALQNKDMNFDETL